VACRDVDPADKVRLAARSASNNKLAWWAIAKAYLAVHFDVLHACHTVLLLCLVCLHRCAQGSLLLRYSGVRADARYLECAAPYRYRQ
jgi:hypothetical protein